MDASRLRSATAYASVALLSVLALGWAMHLGRADLRVPFAYQGDALFHLMLAKGIQENGWFLRNPALGAPGGLELHDFPIPDTMHLLALKGLTALPGTPALALNAYFLLGFPLAALAALFALRRFGCSYPAAGAAALLFAFLPYHFFRSIRHPFLATYFMVPLLTMVIFWVYQDGLRSRRQLAASVALFALAGAGGVYYAFFACVLALVAGGSACLQNRQWRHLVAAGALALVAAASVLLNVAPSLAYQRAHGPNPQAVRRGRLEAETYGLKVTQLLLPVTGHRVGLLARQKERYRTYAPLVNENDWASLGLVGSAGFLLLVGLLLSPRRLLTKGSVLAPLAVLNMAAVLLGTLGGFGALLSLTLLPAIRAYNRLSIFIAFLALSAIAILLDSLRRRWESSRLGNAPWAALLLLILVGGLLDQVPRLAVPPYSALRSTFTSDGRFVRAIESRFPSGAMVFQLPYVPFPEHPDVCRMVDYDHLRGYLHSRRLRWSYGAMRGREGDRWLRDVSARPLPEMLRTLRRAGFAGVYVDRYGYHDNAAALEAGLARLTGARPLVSDDRRLSFFALPASAPRHTGREVRPP